MVALRQKSSQLENHGSHGSRFRAQDGDAVTWIRPDFFVWREIQQLMLGNRRVSQRETFSAKSFGASHGRSLFTGNSW